MGEIGARGGQIAPSLSVAIRVTIRKLFSNWHFVSPTEMRSLRLLDSAARGVIGNDPFLSACISRTTDSLTDCFHSAKLNIYETTRAEDHSLLLVRGWLWSTSHVAVAIRSRCPVARSNTVVVVKSILVLRPADILSCRPLGHHPICQSRARPCLHSPVRCVALEGQTVQWSNGRQSTCGQQIVLLDGRQVERCVVSRIDGKIKGPLGNRRSVDFRLLSAFKVETHNRRFPPLDEREIILPPLRAKICTPSCSPTAVSRMLMCLVTLVRLTAAVLPTTASSLPSV